MKYLKIILAIVLSAAFLFIYLFIPNRIVVSDNIYIPQAGSSVTRGFVQIQYWDKWMPRKTIQGHSFIWEDGELEINAAFIASVKSRFSKEDFEAGVIFSAVDAGKDSSLVRFEAEVDNRHLSPLTRIHNYVEAQKLKIQLNKVIRAASAYYSSTKGIYGFEIIESKVKDTTLITTQQNFPDTPSLVQQYKMIDLLLNHIKKHNGIIHSEPMVNITRLGDKEVFTQVGFALAADIPAGDQMAIKKMVLGNILETKVIGGQRKINAAFEANKLYLSDHLRTSPAMPYVTYNTNRLLEKDESKWQSTIYYPVY
jgi:hypothetical protein